MQALQGASGGGQDSAQQELPVSAELPWLHPLQSENIRILR